MFGTQALLAAHERMCMEDRERTRAMFQEVKLSIEAVERRQEAAAAQLSSALIDLQASVAKITIRVAWMLGAATAGVVLIEHFHLLARL